MSIPEASFIPFANRDKSVLSLFQFSCVVMSVQSSVSVGPLTRSASARVTDAKKGVQKGFLKHARSSQPKIASEMNVEAKDYFAFIGFPVNSDPYEMCNLIKEHCHDHLREFDLRVLGWAQFEKTQRNSTRRWP